MYVGSWAGRRWFFPTISYQSSSRPGSPRWHVPEQARFISRLWAEVHWLISGFILAILLDWEVVRRFMQMPEAALGQ